MAQYLNKALIKQTGDALLPIVTAQQRTQQIGWFTDEFRGDLKYMAQNEFLCSIVAQHSGSVPLLGFVERIQITTVQGGHNGIAQVGEYLPEIE